MLHDITFQLQSSEFLAILGPNGAGKTTLLKTLVGLLKPWRGIVNILGHDIVKDLGKVRRFIGYVPQLERINLDLPLRVIDVVLAPRIIRSDIAYIKHREKDVNEAMMLLEMVDLKEHTYSLFTELSGGQQQKVLIARALMAKPKILILDEPLSMVDPISRTEIASLLGMIKKEFGITIIVSTHDINPLYEITDKVLLLKDGRLIAFGGPGEVLNYELLSKVYGSHIRVIPIADRMICILGDAHV